MRLTANASTMPTARGRPSGTATMTSAIAMVKLSISLLKISPPEKSSEEEATDVKNQ